MALIPFVFCVYSCHIPDCDNQIDPIYDQPWVQHAVPGTLRGQDTFVPEQCEYYEREANQSSSTTVTSNECPAYWFSDRVSHCERWVFDDNERTIVNDVSTLSLVNLLINK